MTRPGRAWVVVCVGAALAGLLVRGAYKVEAKDRTAPLRTQTDSSPAPTIQVYSRETIVDVTVLDAKGQPVHGLTMADFTVREDGRPQPIRSFAEFGTGGAAMARTPQPVMKMPPHVYTNRQAEATTGAVNVIVLDSVNLGMDGQMRAKLEVAKYLRRMPPGTKAAMLRLGAELQFVQGFTSDPEVLIAAMNDMKNTVMPPGISEPCLRSMAPRLTTEGLRQIGALLAGVKGKKNVLWFTGNVTQLPSAVDCGDAAKRLDLEKALELLAAAEVTVYRIDVRGVMNLNPPLSAQFGDNTPALMRTVETYGGEWFDRNVVGQTGGRFFGGNNDFVGEISEAIETGSNYYTISYVPAHGNDGNYHHITVKVDRPGLSLMYRPGYGADDVAKIAAETRIPTTLGATTPEPGKNTMVASMARFAPVATQVLFDVKVAPTTEKPTPTDAAVMGFPVAALRGKPMVRYDVSYSLPAEQIAFTDGPDGVYRGSMEFDVVASDVFGKLITSVSRTIPLTADAAEYAEFVKQPFRFFQQIDLPPGQSYVRVGVLDKVSNKVGTVEVPLKVAKGNGVTEAGR